MTQIHLDVMHCSMQFSDSLWQKKQDAQRIFGRARRTKRDWVTGTEAGQRDLRKALGQACEEHGYRLHVAQDVWVAVSKNRIEGGWREGFTKVVDSSRGRGQHGDRGIGWVSFEHTRVGTVSIGVCHYLTQGRKVKDPNYHLNTQLARAVGEWGRERGQGSALAFYAGDQNIPDLVYDTFRGAPFTSLADELGKPQNTGHGSIDVIASYDHDKRVKGRYWRVLDDKEFWLHSDHFACEGGFDVRVG